MKIGRHEIIEGEQTFIIDDFNERQLLCRIGKRRFIIERPDEMFEVPYKVTGTVVYTCIATYPKAMRGKRVDLDWTEGNFAIYYSLNGWSADEWDRPETTNKFVR